ncbi:hypothetical protein O3M35_002925 [Rhynocoris fuscipes]|uniref:Uncharacterized protein n=1 Tax=Rhynocoris fuscipes TaxID=488301 RepID=A0AAW1CNN6_9HEMI
MMGSDTGYRSCLPHQELGYPWQPHWTNCKYEAPQPSPAPPPPPKRYLLSVNAREAVGGTLADWSPAGLSTQSNTN